MRKIQTLFPNKIKPELYDHNIFTYKTATENGLGQIMFGNKKLVAQLQAPYPVFEPNGKPARDYPKGPDGRDNAQKTRTNINPDQSLRAVIFRDSFFRVLEPYFNRKMQSATYIWKKLNYPDLSKYTKQKQPDIIIEEWAERKLPYVPPFNKKFENALNKARFNLSNKLLFADQYERLKFNKWLEVINEDKSNLRLRSNGNNPVIFFPPLTLNPNDEYVVNIKLDSNVKSTLQLFYSVTNNSGKQFTPKNTVRTIIKPGDNDVYLPLSHPNLGKRLRLDPISTAGEFTIKSLEIKRTRKAKIPG